MTRFVRPCPSELNVNLKPPMKLWLMISDSKVSPVGVYSSSGSDVLNQR